MTRQTLIGLVVLVTCFFCGSHVVNASSDNPLDVHDTVRLLNGGNHFALMRHAMAPGTGDPVEFKIDDCATQRNLSSDGRAQAERIGQLLRDNGIKGLQVYSSQWCRCLETAELLQPDSVTALPLLNSFFQNRAAKSEQTQALINWLLQQPLNTNEPVLLVTHQVNITAFSGIYPDSGEVLIIRRSIDDELEVAGYLEASGH